MDIFLPDIKRLLGSKKQVMCKRIKTQTVLILLCNTESRIRLSSAWRFFQRELLWFNNCNSRKKLQKRNICSDSQHLRKYITCVFSLNKILERVIQTTEGVSQLWIKKCHIMQSWWQLMKPKNSMSKIKIKCSLWEKKTYINIRNLDLQWQILLPKT